MKLSMLFPGQGSQSVGMLNGYGDAPEVLETVRMGSYILAQDLEKMLREGPTGDLSRYRRKLSDLNNSFVFGEEVVFHVEDRVETAIPGQVLINLLKINDILF